jgi:hypothetical protein
MMIILDATTKSLKIVLAGAVAATQLPVVAHYTDITTTAYTPGSNDTVTNSTTVVEFVAAPAASTQRHVESISVYNVDTAAATVTIQYVSTGGTRQIIKVVLLTLEQLFYEDGTGWQIIDTNGNLKTAHSPAVPSATAASDFIVADASPFAWIKKTLVETKALLGLVITAGKTITVTQDTALDEAVAMSSKAPKTATIAGDGTAGRVLRIAQLSIADGTAANTLTCSLSSVFNGDIISETDNIAKNATTGNFSLSADGTALTIQSAGLAGEAIAVLAAAITYDNSGITTLRERVYAGATNIVVLLGIDTAAGFVDLTTIAADHQWYIVITYLTSA